MGIDYNLTAQYDFTSETAETNQSAFKLTFFIFKICMAFMTVILNTMIIIIIVRLNKKQSFSNYLFLSSAIADLLIGLIPQPSMITYTYFYQSLNGENSCFYWLILNNSCLFLNISLFNLLLITMHRYNQLKSALIHDKPTNFRYFLIGVVWLLSTLFWSLMIIPVFISHKSHTNFECTRIFSVYYIIFIELTILITPIVLIIILNIFTYVELRRKAAKMRRCKTTHKINSSFRTLNNRVLSNSDNCLQDKNNQQKTTLLSPNTCLTDQEQFINLNRSFNLKYTSNHNDVEVNTAKSQENLQKKGSVKRPAHFDYFRRKLTRERKAFLCLSSISVGLISSWLMFLVVWPMRALCDECISELLFSISVWCNYSSAAANPLILLIFHSKFQNEFLKILAFIFKHKPRHQEPIN